ncbi:MAG: MATE family efflux transporter [Alphaproteobacteria bacterium]|nr:MATE family efflux transporter [Rhodospirillaceae bacterium]MDG2482654.1 MATE family efflux transporter [Alphaproteobacteria bacterium]MBT6204341.1 MATE family efflux transporter [Rhodospirillaceae bacterium]MBT6509154.1 MATE family efflux transporter [Rhodospirillaceae bacterium]MBT7614691.1 MATE family efflux transporter [Rhodospirillaceae bacterium]
MSPALLPWLRETRAVVHLAVPLALTQLALMAIMTTDVVLMGWIGADELAAGTLASHFYWAFVAFGFGTLTGATPMMAQHLGARRFRRIRPVMRQAMWLSLLLAIPISQIAWFSGSILPLLGQETEVAANVQSYLRYIVFGLLPAMWFMVLSEFLAAHARPRAVMVVTILAIALNGLLDYALMFGNLGAPEMGLDGAGLASAIVNVSMFLALLVFVMRDHKFRRYRLLGRLWRIEWPNMFEIVRVGMPIAVTEVAEMGMFTVLSLMMGVLGTDALAAHGVTSQCYAVIFMIPVGIAQAAAVRVGRAVGANDPHGAARSGWTALSLGALAALVPSLAFWFAGHEVASLILNDGNPENTAALDLAVTILAVATFFMIADAVMISARGALQGMKDTKVPMFIALGTSWGFGLPIAALLGFELELGGPGIWAGMAAAIGCASILVLWRFHVLARRLKKPA